MKKFEEREKEKFNAMTLSFMLKYKIFISSVQTWST